MTSLRSFLEPVIRRQRLWRLWRMLAWCWGLVAVAAGAAWVMSANLGAPETSVDDRLIMALVGGTLVVLLLNLPKSGVDYRQVARDVEEKHPELHAALLTAVEQRPDPETGQFNFLQERVIAKAVEAFKQTNFENAVPTKQLNVLRTCSLGLLALAFAMIYRIPEGGPNPMAQPQPSSEEQAEEEQQEDAKLAKLVKVDPGDTEIERGSR